MECNLSDNTKRVISRKGSHYVTFGGWIRAQTRILGPQHLIDHKNNSKGFIEFHKSGMLSYASDVITGRLSCLPHRWNYSEIIILDFFSPEWRKVTVIGENYSEIVGKSSFYGDCYRRTIFLDFFYHFLSFTTLECLMTGMRKTSPG